MKFKNTELPIEERVEDFISQLSVKEKAGQLIMRNEPIERLGIGFYHWWNEALHGYAQSGVATVFPQAIGLAASWSPELLYAVADIISTEGRAISNEALVENNGNSKGRKGMTIWSPNINIFRDPRWGRGQETYGEDPYLTASLADGFIKGIQGDDEHYLKGVATVKHFAVHSGPEALRHKFDVPVSERDLWDTYLPAFEDSIRNSDAKSVMSAYNGFNGSPCVAHTRLLTEILREQWGFEGAVVGDVDNVEDLYNDHGHHLTETGAEAVALAIKAGNDLRSGGGAEHIEQAVEKGLLTEADLDKALERLCTLRFKLGHFDPIENTPWGELKTDVIESQKHINMAYEACKQSLVLLKNDGVLPLNPKSIKKIAVIGPTSDDIEVLQGNYSGTPFEPVTILKGLKNKSEAYGIEVLDEINFPFANGHSTKGMPIPSGVFYTDEAMSERGLNCKMYNGSAEDEKSVLEKVDLLPELEWNTALPAPSVISTERAIVVWSGFMKLEYSGEYTLYPSVCGEVKILIDDKEVLHTNAGLGKGGASGKVQLSSDKVLSVKIIWSQKRSEGFFNLDWDPADGGLGIKKAYDRALEIGEEADVIILTLGISHKLEGEEMTNSPEGFSRGDRTSIMLPEPQQKIMDSLKALGKPMVLLLSSGSAISFDPSLVNAAMQTWYYGARGGQAIADALFGEFSPAGRLPVTFYKSDSDLPDFEDYKMQNRTYRYFGGEVLYAFGHGLSYTKFSYKNFVVEKSTINETISTEVTLCNEGKMSSDEVVQIYAELENPLQEDPIQWLVAYKRVENMEASESRVIKLYIDLKRLHLWSEKVNKKCCVSGNVIFKIGSSSDTLSINSTIAI